MTEKARRAKGEGSIYQRADGYYVGVLDLGWHGGRRVRKQVVAKTLRECRAKFAKLKREAEQGVLTDNTTVKGWLEHWLADIAPTRCRQRTLDGYATYVNHWLIPQLGKHRLDKLRPDHVRALHKAMEAAGKSDATRRQAHAILRRALVVAERDGRISRNPAALVDPPPVGRNHHTPLTLEQARQVLKVLDSDPLAARWLCALLQGMRQGECLGLRWEDVDLEHGVIHVRQELLRLKGQGMTVTELKSDTSKRDIPMLPPTLYALSMLPRRGEFVFYGDKTDSRKDWAAWKAILVKAGVCDADAKLGDMPALHAARGTTASLLDAAGVSDKIIAEILGHSSVQITRSAYIHGDDERRTAAMRSLDAYVHPPEEE